MASLSATLKQIESAYTKLDPNFVLEGNGGRQEKKSAHMQLQILEATVKQLTEIGYANTTTQIVAQTASVSRGALLHHYATRLQLIVAVIDFLSTRMLREYASQIVLLSEQERMREGSGVEVLWNLTKTPESQAWLEISAASRTDTELRDVFLPRAKKHDKLIASLIPEIFPEWAGTALKDRQLAHDLVNVLVKGLDVHKDVMASRNRRVAVRKFIFDVVQTLRSENPN